jgi:hypothetical protein
MIPTKGPTLTEYAEYPEWRRVEAEFYNPRRGWLDWDVVLNADGLEVECSVPEYGNAQLTIPLDTLRTMLAMYDAVPAVQKDEP